jgi:triphosphoribosyl-dephospho-CoA synthetase
VTRPPGRIRPCAPADAVARVDHALRFLETAEVVLEDTTRQAYANVAGALAVLAGVAMADAVCCRALGRYHRGRDHRAAADLLRAAAGVGAGMALDLERLLAIKDKAGYQSGYLSRADARRAVGWARRMVAQGTEILRVE